MSRDRSKEQSYYKIKVWFKHRTKVYTVTSYEKLMDFLMKAEENETIIHYLVEAYSIFIYPEYQGKKFRKQWSNKNQDSYEE